VLAQKRFDGSTDFCDKGTGATTEEHEMCFAIASMPAVFDLDFDGFADVIYVGDLGGNVWRWAIHALGEDRVNDGSVSPTQPNWPFRRFFQGLVGSPHYKSFFTTPAGAIQNGTLYIALGSGERADIAFVGKSGQDEDNNRLYVITDPDPLESSGPPAGVLAETDLTDLSATASCSAIPGRGYFFLAAEGEKFVSRTNIFAGLVIAASFTPDPTAGLCEPRGDGLLYIFDLDCGEGYFTDGGSPSRSESLGTGMPTDPQISLGVDGTNNVIYIEKSSGELESLEAPDLGLDNGGIIYWREVE
jgi:type IV pilus assembly protein PilY1